jgi:hypothetical protein
VNEAHFGFWCCGFMLVFCFCFCGAACFIILFLLYLLLCSDFFIMFSFFLLLHWILGMYLICLLSS